MLSATHSTVNTNVVKLQRSLVFVKYHLHILSIGLINLSVQFTLNMLDIVLRTWRWIWGVGFEDLGIVTVN